MRKHRAAMMLGRAEARREGARCEVASRRAHERMERRVDAVLSRHFGPWRALDARRSWVRTKARGASLTGTAAARPAHSRRR